MTQNENKYTADKGKWFVRKPESFVMGEILDMGIYDSIENYDEVTYTKEEYKEFCNKYKTKISRLINQEEEES